jgi:glyoxylase-like metal-dependent hydrolase (beta-lactamase superfamily II)
MNKICAMAAIVAAALGCASETPEQQAVESAAAALGGRDRILAVRTVSLEDGTGRLYNLGQDLRPDARGQIFEVTGLSRRYDLGAGAERVRTELTRTPAFPYFQGQAAVRQIQGVDGGVGYNIAANGTATRVPETAARDRRTDFYHYPLTLVRTALAPGARLSNATRTDTERRVDVTVGDGIVLTLITDAAGLPTRIESKTAHINLGDVRMATVFADYQDVSGLKLPATVMTRVDEFVTAELQFGRQTVDAAVDIAAPPAAAAAAPQPAAPNVVVQDVAPGVWLLAGQSHHSAAIELSDQVLLVDAPQSEARTLAVLERAAQLRPGKPLRKIVTTHHHFDHTAGIRAATAAGLTIVTHAGNRTFFEQVTTRPHTIVPDTLAKTPRAATIETVDDELVIKDSLRTVGLYHVIGNPHSETMLMIHLPAERLLIQVDAFSPGAQVNPYAANLLENVVRRKLSVERIIPLHGTIAPFEALAKIGS